MDRLKFKLVRIFLKAIKTGLDNCVKTIQDERLARYVLEEIGMRNALYNKDYFAIPTIENTSLLRDYVHHKLTKEHESLEKASYKLGKTPMLQVLKWLEDKRYKVQCGGLAQILLGIYRGLGYNAILCDWVDIGSSHYTDSHMLVEVYIPELEKYIIQDAAYNMIVTHKNMPINTLELMFLLREGEILENREISFVNNIGKEEGVFTPISKLSYEQYFRYFGQVVSWDSDSNIMYPATILHRYRSSSNQF